MTGRKVPSWPEIEASLDTLLDLPEADRPASLAQLCADDPPLGAAVGRLLDAAAKGSSPLDLPMPRVTPDLVAECLDAPDPGPPPTVVGPWRLIREIGRGGMGAVYLAERDDGQYRQRAAVKLVAGGSAAGLEIRRRFAVERQILATLEHPGIARLLDGGASEQGEPYLAMEFVDGVRLGDYCAAGALDRDARLDLFDRVAAAVSFAHQQLVVHRDLKPANILVNARGEVKLLDFGIAKLLAPDAATEPETRPGAFLATPDYASPEQVRGHPVSTATDVHALGLILYELLTGRRPFDAATDHELARAICDDPPPRPGLGNDLDAIVLLALAKEPRHRYQSVEALREDLRRFRGGFPVRARPATRRYRARKFLARNRGLLAGAGLVLVASAAGVVATVWQAQSAAREARRAERVVEFLTGIFAVSDPDAAQGEDVTARQLLERGARTLDQSLAGEPALRAELLRTVGVLHHRLGDYDRAGTLLMRAGAILDSADGSAFDRAAVAASLASVLHDQGRDAQAEPMARQVLAQRRAGGGPLFAMALNDLAAIVSGQGRFAEAESLYRVALAADRGRNDPSALSVTLANLAILRQQQGDLDEAGALLREAVAIDLAQLGERHTRTATSLQNLASNHLRQGAYDSAEVLLSRVIRIREQLLGPEHPLVAHALAQLGLAYQQHGRLDSAYALNSRVLDLRRKALGEEHPLVAETWNNLAVTEYHRARFAEAASHIERAVQIWRASLGETHPSVLSGLANLGAIRRAGGDLAGAEPVLREVLALRRKVLGEQHADVASSHNNLGLLLEARGRTDEALASYRQAERTWRSALGEAHVTVAEALVAQGKLLCATGRHAGGEAPLREAVGLRRAALDSASMPIAIAERELAICLAALGRGPEAESLLVRALPRMEAQWGAADPGTVRARDALERVRGRRP